MKTTTIFALLLLGASVVVPAATAQPSHSEPGSFLIFPLVDTRNGQGTIITITNTNRSHVRCPNGETAGMVNLRYKYINGTNCAAQIVPHALTAGDTLTTFADVDSNQNSQGWLFVEARDPAANVPIDFDFLIGSAIIVATGGAENFLSSYTAYSFKALTASDDNDGCDRDSTDLNTNNRADFNGLEYEFFPQALVLDRFFQQAGAFGNEIAIITTVGVQIANPPVVNANFAYFNNRENINRPGDPACSPIVSPFSFTCFKRSALAPMIAPGVTALNGDPNELVRGSRRIQTGWARITSAAPLLAVFTDRLTLNARVFEGGRELWYEGALGDDPGEVAAFLPHN